MIRLDELRKLDPTFTDDYPEWMGTEEEWQVKMRNAPVDIQAAQKRIDNAFKEAQ